MGLGANHPHSFQFLPVISAVSFDPFSVTLCSRSWYDFSRLCPPLLFLPKQTTQMRNPRYWWTGRLFKKEKKTTLYWALLLLLSQWKCQSLGLQCSSCRSRLPLICVTPREGSMVLAACWEYRSASYMSWTLSHPLITAHIHLTGGGGDAD